MQADSLDVPSETVLYETALSYAKQFDTNLEKEKEKEGNEKKWDQEISRDSVLGQLLPQIRFNFIPMSYLADVIEDDESVMRLPVMQSLLFETYRYKAVAGAKPTLFNCTRRTGDGISTCLIYPSIYFFQNQLIHLLS